MLVKSGDISILPAPERAGNPPPAGDHQGVESVTSAPLRSLVLVGLMGAGKSSIGKKLAGRLGFGFVDADSEIEKAAGSSIADIFAEHGEAAFREGEKRVIARLLDQPEIVLATGGGAYMNAETRAKIRQNGISIWINADLDVLVRRCMRRSHRPLLQNGDMRGTLARLMEQRYPVYAEAEYSVRSTDGPQDGVIEDILAVLPEAYRARAEEREAAGREAAAREASPQESLP